MVTRKLLSPFVIALAVAALPAWSAESAPRLPDNPMNPLGAESIVNPLLPSPG
jgi:hypothetical protein